MGCGVGGRGRGGGYGGRNNGHAHVAGIVERARAVEEAAEPAVALGERLRLTRALEQLEAGRGWYRCEYTKKKRGV